MAIVLERSITNPVSIRILSGYIIMIHFIIIIIYIILSIDIGYYNCILKMLVWC